MKLYKVNYKLINAMIRSSNILPPMVNILKENSIIDKDITEEKEEITILTINVKNTTQSLLNKNSSENITVSNNY